MSREGRRALAIAGLDHELGAEHELDRFQEAFDVLDAALAAHEVVPTLNEAVRFARANGMWLPDVLNPYAGLLELWRRSRDQRGLTNQPYEPHSSHRPDFGQRVLGAPTQRIRRGYWTEERAVEAMRRFLDTQAPGEATTRKSYVDWSKGDREAPAASDLDREFGGFARIRDLPVTGLSRRIFHPRGVDNGVARVQTTAQDKPEPMFRPERRLILFVLLTTFVRQLHFPDLTAQHG